MTRSSKVKEKWSGDFQKNLIRQVSEAWKGGVMNSPTATVCFCWSLNHKKMIQQEVQLVQLLTHQHCPPDAFAHWEILHSRRVSGRMSGLHVYCLVVQLSKFRRPFCFCCLRSSQPCWLQDTELFEYISNVAAGCENCLWSANSSAVVSFCLQPFFPLLISNWSKWVKLMVKFVYFSSSAFFSTS